MFIPFCILRCILKILAEPNHFDDDDAVGCDDDDDDAV